MRNIFAGVVMSVHFAAARCASRSPVARALTRRTVRRAANDNPGGTLDADARVLHAALRHFADHGLRAAEEAVAMAEKAWREGEPAACAWWTEVCRKLDRKLAAYLVQRTAMQDVS